MYLDVDSFEVFEINSVWNQTFFDSKKIFANKIFVLLFLDIICYCILLASNKAFTQLYNNLFLYIFRIVVAVIFQYNEVYDCAISCDTAGMLEYWAGQKRDFGFPKNLKFEYKTDTDLFEFVAVSSKLFYNVYCTGIQKEIRWWILNSSKNPSYN